MVQVQAVNNHAVRKYADFQFAIQQVATALEETDKLLKSLADSAGGRVKGFTVPDKKELTGLRTKALATLDALRESSKRYEAELLSRGWRV